jgi:8-oxo-dGTP pyrophosphatase MutT (NUDIX family)
VRAGASKDDRVRRMLVARTPLILPIDPARRQAAVLLPLFASGSALHLVFTKRTDTLKHHKGQVSFPGGTLDPKDGDLLTTALRESYEELGIPPEHVTVLGRLDDLATFSTSFTISPFVGLIPYPYSFHPNPMEVASIFAVPLSVLADPAVVRSYTRTREDHATLIDYEFHVGGHVIWGATARILHHFLQVIKGCSE